MVPYALTPLTNMMDYTNITSTNSSSKVGVTKKNKDVCKKLELKILKFDRMADIFVIS